MIKKEDVNYYIDEIKKYLAEGWSLSLSRRKAGLNTSNDYYVLKSDEYKQLSKDYRSKINGNLRFDLKAYHYIQPKNNKEPV